MERRFLDLTEGPTTGIFFVCGFRKGSLGRISTFNLRQNQSMSAIGTQRTSLVAPHMFAFGGKADMPFALHSPLMTQSGHSHCLKRQNCAYKFHRQ